MAPSVETLAEAAAGLTVVQKLSLANRLLATVESSPTAGAEAAWAEVIGMRRARYLAGAAETVSMEEAFQSVEQNLGARA